MPATLSPSLLPARAFQQVDRKSRALFHWRAADLSLTPLTGQVATFARNNNGGTYRDARGQLRYACPNQPRWHYFDLDNDGVFETVGLMIEEASTNVVQRSELLNTAPWATTGTVAFVAAGLRLGDLVLNELADQDAGVDAAFYQDPVFTTTAAKGISLFVAEGTTPASTLIRLRDESAGTDKLSQLLTWVGGLPVLTPSAGLHLATEYWGRATPSGQRVFRLLFQAAALTHTNTIRLYVYPDNGGVGNVYVGGVQAEDGLFPTTYIPTAGAATATRVAEDLTYAVAFGRRDLTAFADMIVPWLGLATADASTNLAALSMGDANFSDYFGLLAHNGGASLFSQVLQKGAGGTATTKDFALPATPAAGGYGGRLRLLGRYDHAGAVIYGARDGLAVASQAVNNRLADDFATVRLGVFPSTDYLTGALLSAKVAAGLLTDPQMRELL